MPFFCRPERSEEIIQRLNRALVVTLQSPGVRGRLHDIGRNLFELDHLTPEYLGKFVAAEIEKWARATKASGIQLD